MDKQENLILIGMPGSGKSTLGKQLAKALHMRFMDADRAIEKETGEPLQKTIDRDGPEAFLRVEERVLLSLCVSGCVLATGGSAVYSDAAMKHLKTAGRAVYLSVPFSEIQARLADFSGRGIVLKNGCGLKDAYLERMPLYEKYADITVDCAGLSADECLNALLLRLE